MKATFRVRNSFCASAHTTKWIWGFHKILTLLTKNGFYDSIDTCCPQKENIVDFMAYKHPFCNDFMHLVSRKAF